MTTSKRRKENFEILIPANKMSETHTFTFTPMDDDKEESDENLMFTGDSGESNLPVDPTTLMIKDNDRRADPGDGLAFSRVRYTFDLPEHRDGREEPYALGVVTARDPDGQPLMYALAAGDESRFAVGASDGAVTYVGPGEDYETGPREYRLTLRVRNGNRETASATVVVRVTDEPEAPVAADDTAETPEDEPTLVDVLANVSAPDGKRLRVASVTAPEHGTVSVESGGIRYAPASNYHGPDRFRYTVAGANGMMDTAMVKRDGSAGQRCAGGGGRRRRDARGRSGRRGCAGERHGRGWRPSAGIVGDRAGSRNRHGRGGWCAVRASVELLRAGRVRLHRVRPRRSEGYGDGHRDGCCRSTTRPRPWVPSLSRSSRRAASLWRWTSPRTSPTSMATC